MNFIDIIIILIIIFYSFRGYRRGLIYEVFSIGIVIIGLAVALLFFRQLSIILNQYFNNKDLSMIIAFIVIFIGIAILLVTIRNILSNLIDTLNLTELDSILGLVVGALKAILVISIVLIFLERHSILGLDKSINKSFTYPFMKRIFFAFISVLPAKMKMIVFSVL